MSFIKNFSNPNLYKLFGNSPSERFDFTMNNIHDNFFSNLLANSTDGVFNAVCLSGFQTEQTTLQENSVVSAINDLEGGNFYIIVRPLTNFGSMLPDPRNYATVEEITEVIAMHRTTFLARANYSNNGSTENPISFGQIIQCRFEEGSILSSDFRGLTFDYPTYIDYEESYRFLGVKLGVVTAAEAILSGTPTQMGARFSPAISPSAGAQSVLKELEDNGKFLNVDNIMKKYANDFPAMPEGTLGGAGVNEEVFKNAVEEQLAFWKGHTEEEPYVFPMLKSYYDHARFGNNWDPVNTPWSAVFISYQLRDYNFKAGSSHYKYTNHVKNGKSNGWQHFSLTKTDENYLSVSDVLVYGRDSGPPGSKPYTRTHGDVVYKIKDGIAYLAGGNVGNTAQIKQLQVDAQGKLLSLKNDKNNVYTVILKKTDYLTGNETSPATQEVAIEELPTSESPIDEYAQVDAQIDDMFGGESEV